MANLPSGTVTFLFTDIEGSTERWEQRTEAMQTALARHDALLRAAILEHGGHVVKTMGDAFHAAFSRAPDALAAAVEAQRRLIAESWDEIGGLRVRMALHTGAAEERDGDYYGPPLNRAARLMSAGHGGQVLLSQTTYDLVRDTLPAGASLLDLGEHRLKDLIRPERIFQIVAPDLTSTFPPLQTLERRPHNLPVHPTALLGRNDDIALVRERLSRDDVRLLTLTGPGGTGKTRLSLQIAADLIDQFPDGVFWVALAPISDPDLVASMIAQTLDVRVDARRSIVESLKERLAGKQVLLLLDNFEQILPAASVVSELLSAAPRLKILLTSRAALQVRGEHEYPVPPLALPDRREAAVPAVLSQYSAVALFIERAVAIKPDFAVTAENAPSIAEICHRLDGLPLAIELAAARIRLLTPQAILTRLERRLPLLTGGARDLPARQRTLRNAIAWSYGLLTPEEQTLYRRLSVFVGGCVLAAAEAVCDPDGSLGLDLLDGITSLAAQSIVRQAEGPDGEPRFGMLETIREYGLEQLQASGEEPAVRRRHLTYFTERSEQVEQHLFGSQKEGLVAQQWAEADNVRAALAWSLVERTPEITDDALRLVSAYSDVWYEADQHEEGRRWGEHVLAMDREHTPRGEVQGDAPASTRSYGAWASRPSRESSKGQHPRVAALNAVGYLATMDQIPDIALARTDEALTVARAVGDRLGQAVALMDRAFLASFRGDAEAVTLGEESLAMYRALGDRNGARRALQLIGNTWLNLGDHQGARRYLEESLALTRSAGDVRATAQLLRFLGWIAFLEGDLERAMQLLDESAAWWERMPTRSGIQALIRDQGRLLFAHGDHEAAAVRLRESLRLSAASSDGRSVITCLEALAGVLASIDGSMVQAQRAARLLGAAAAMRTTRKLPIPRVDRPTYEQALAATRATLSEHAFETVFAEGQAMTQEEAVAVALGETNLV
jgi:predicted ATPase/class 3 adenylate cyclase